MPDHPLPPVGTHPGVLHADMHPATRARVDAHAMLGRRIAAHAEAVRMLGAGEATPAYVARMRGELDQALHTLIERAQAEGAAEYEDAAAVVVLTEAEAEELWSDLERMDDPDPALAPTASSVKVMHGLAARLGKDTP
jgi:hypothetical protein